MIAAYLFTNVLTYDSKLHLRRCRLGPPVVDPTPVQPAVRGPRRGQSEGPLGRPGLGGPRRDPEGGPGGEDGGVGPVLRRAPPVVKAGEGKGRQKDKAEPFLIAGLLAQSMTACTVL